MEPASPAVEAPPVEPAAARPRLMRSGSLMDTGDAMPCTEFHRPNPLDSDIIMDATARLLSSRRAPAARTEGSRSEQARSGRRRQRSHSGQPRQENQAPKTGELGKGEPRKKSRGTRSGKGPEGAEKPESARQGQPAKKGGQSRKKRGEGQPSARPQSAAAPRRERSKQPRAPQPPARSQLKDSTEQASLMKPFYLHSGR